MASISATAGIDLVVLGHRLTPEGAATGVLVRRLEEALALDRVRGYGRFVLTGGVPRAGQTEAGVMRAYLLHKGADPERIVVEQRSANTVENAVHVRDLGVRYPHVVTSPYHAGRAGLIFRRVYGHPVPILTAPIGTGDLEEARLTLLEPAKLLLAHARLAWKGF